MLARLLAVRPGEGAIALRLGGHFFLVLAATTAHNSAADAIFLRAYPAARLPLVYATGAVLSVLASMAYGALLRRHGPRTTSTVVTLGLATLLVALRFTLDIAPDVGPFLLLATLPVYVVLFSVENAGLVARALDSRASRRLYPAITALGGIGATSGGFLVAGLARPLGVANVLWIAVAALLLSLPVALGVRGIHRAAPRTRPATWSRVLAHPLARALVVTVVLTSALQVCVKYQMGAAAKEALAPDALAVFLGQLYGWLNAASIAVGFLVARPLVARLGVGGAMLVHPLLVMAAASVGLLVPGLAAMTAALVVERLLRQNVQRPLVNIAMMPMPEPVRVRTALALRGTLEPPVTTVVSLAILLTSAVLPWEALSVAVLAAAAGCTYAGVKARRAYREEVVAALHARRLRCDDDTVGPTMLGPDVRRLLNGQLASETPERAEFAFRALRGRADAATVRVVAEHWPRWSDALRSTAADVLSEDPTPEASAFLRARFEGASEPLRAALLRAGAAVPTDAQLDAWIATASDELAAAAMATALSRGRALGERYRMWTRDGDVRRRVLAAYVAGHVPDPVLAGAELSALAPDAPAEVAAALARRPIPALAPLALSLLSNQAAYDASRAALLAMGAEGRAALVAAARDPERSSTAIGVLGASDHAGAHDALLDLLEDTDEELRFRAGRALARRRDVRGPREAERVRAALAEELRRAHDLRRIARGANDVLAKEAEAQLRWTLERAFQLLDVLEPGRTYRRVFLSLLSEDPTQRAFGVEALDETLPEPWRERILPLVEESQEAHAAPEGADPWLTRLERALGAPGSDPDIDRALALKASGPFSEWPLRDLEQLVRAASTQSAGPRLVVQGGEVVDLEQTLLGVPASRPPPGPSDSIALEAVWLTIARRARCAAPWLGALARRMPPARARGPDTSATFVSLASRAPDEQMDGARGTLDVETWRRTFFLSTVPLFEELPPESLRLLAEITVPRSARAGTLVVREGRPGHHLYVVCAGSVEVSSDGRRLALLRSTDAFGLFALVAGEPRSASVRAVEDVELLSMERVDFLDLLDAHPGLVPVLSRLLARRVLLARGDSA